MITDPTKKEMMDFLAQEFSPEEQYDFAAEEAIYWFANNWHSGQNSNLYSVLSTSPFKPGRLQSGIDLEDALTWSMYEALEEQFADVIKDIP